MPKLNVEALPATDKLDITPLRERGAELHTAICNAVKDTQSGALFLPLPYVIIMTMEQFKSLDPEGHMVAMQTTDGHRLEDRIYRTPDNIMEVHVKDPNREEQSSFELLRIENNMGELLNG